MIQSDLFPLSYIVSLLRTAFHLFLCEECSLGMENRLIKDAQITASSQWNSNYAANQARLNFKAGRVKQGGWSARWNNANQWIQVSLGSFTKITGIATQGRNGYSEWVTKYQLQYSDDGVNFHYYKASGQSSPKVKAYPSDNVIHFKLILELYSYQDMSCTSFVLRLFDADVYRCLMEIKTETALFTTS